MGQKFSFQHEYILRSIININLTFRVPLGCKMYSDIDFPLLLRIRKNVSKKLLQQILKSVEILQFNNEF